MCLYNNEIHTNNKCIYKSEFKKNIIQKYQYKKDVKKVKVITIYKFYTIY